MRYVHLRMTLGNLRATTCERSPRDVSVPAAITFGCLTCIPMMRGYLPAIELWAGCSMSSKAIPVDVL